MLTSQINYFAGPDDQRLIEGLIEADGRFHFLREPLFSSDIALSPIVPPLQERQWAPFMMLVRPGDEKRIGLKLVETQDYYLPDVVTGYFVEYGRCYFDGKILCKNRMCFIATCGIQHEKLRYKDEDFVKDARSLFRKVKKVLTPIEGGWYAGKHAIQLRKHGIEFDFMNFGRADLTP